MTKATRAMYPLSSSRERKKNSVTMIGKKLSTEPTPLKMPSMTRECKTGLMFAAVMAASTVSVSQPTPRSSRSERTLPITLKVSQKTSAMMRMNDGMAVYLPVRILSIRRLRACSRLSRGLMTVAAHTRLMKRNRISAMAAARSSPRSFSNLQYNMPEHILFILVKPELLKDKLISLRQLGSRKPNGNAGLHGVILDEVHDGVDGAVNGAAHIVCAAEIDAAGLFLVSRHVDGMAHNLVDALVLRGGDRE